MQEIKYDRKNTIGVYPATAWLLRSHVLSEMLLLCEGNSPPTMRPRSQSGKCFLLRAQKRGKELLRALEISI